MLVALALNTWNRFGRRKPWILLGVPIALVGFILIPFAQTAVTIVAFILITNSIYAGSITISFILVAVPAGLIGTKYGRRQAIRIGLTGLTL